MCDHQRFMDLALTHSNMSHDPSTKVGAVIVSRGSVVSLGYNHIPKKLQHLSFQLEDREWKYARVIHAEADALSKIGTHKLDYPIMYVTHHPCERCAAAIVHAGISEVFTHRVPLDLLQRWPGMKVASDIFEEAQIPVTFLDR